MNLMIWMLAFATSIDLFAVSVALGGRRRPVSFFKTLTDSASLAIISAMMLSIGCLLSDQTTLACFPLPQLIGAPLLAALGMRSIRSGLTTPPNRISQGIPNAKTKQAGLVMIGMACGADTMIIGFSRLLQQSNPVLLIVSFTACSFLASWLGLFIGKKLATFLFLPSELTSGLVFVGIALSGH